MNKITLNKLIYYLLLLSSILMGYFAFTDLQISISIVNRSSGWANFLEKFGEIPGLLVLFSGTHIYLAGYLSDLKLKKLFIGVFLLVAASYLFRHLLLTIYYGVTGGYEFLVANQLLIIVLAFIINLIVTGLIRNLHFAKFVKMYSGCSVLLGLCGYLLLIQPIKHLWGRVRFRDLDPLYSNFTYWFIPNGINGNQSFPSGHSAMAWIILPLLLLVIHKKKIVKITLLTLIFIWGTIVSLSRIVIGAHYASDTMLAALVIIILFLIICKNFAVDWLD